MDVYQSHYPSMVSVSLYRTEGTKADKENIRKRPDSAIDGREEDKNQ
jgi:hypothetical protein